jgi:hypothetical protein
MRFLIVLLLSVGIFTSVLTATVDEAISYYSSADTGNCRPPARAFINNIDANYKTGESAGSVYYFTTNNDSYWDGADIGYVCAHGNQWLFALSNGIVYLDNLSNGWGDTDLEWGILYSCLVVASPLEVASWWQPWIIESTDVFDGLHIVNGFRTSALVAPAVRVTNRYCDLIDAGGEILQSWFDAIWDEGYYWTGYDQGCSMFYGTCENDTEESFAADPSPTQTSDFHCWYMDY